MVRQKQSNHLHSILTNFFSKFDEHFHANFFRKNIIFLMFPSFFSVFIFLHLRNKHNFDTIARFLSFFCRCQFLYCVRVDTHPHHSQRWRRIDGKTCHELHNEACDWTVVDAPEDVEALVLVDRTGTNQLQSVPKTAILRKVSFQSPFNFP